MGKGSHSMFLHGTAVRPKQIPEICSENRSGAQEKNDKCVMVYTDAAILCEQCQCGFRCLLKEVPDAELEAFRKTGKNDHEKRMVLS